MTTLFRISQTGARVTKKRGTTLGVRGGGWVPAVVQGGPRGGGALDQGCTVGGGGYILDIFRRSGQQHALMDLGNGRKRGARTMPRVSP